VDLIATPSACPFQWNHGQACCAGSRIFVRAGIYDEFLKRFTAKAKSIKLVDPFGKGVDQGFSNPVRCVHFRSPLRWKDINDFPYLTAHHELHRFW
jgi:hypothetical protein